MLNHQTQENELPKNMIITAAEQNKKRTRQEQYVHAQERNQYLPAFSVCQYRSGSQNYGGNGTQNRFFYENTGKILRKKEDNSGGSDGNENVKEQCANTKEQKKSRVQSPFYRESPKQILS